MRKFLVEYQVPNAGELSAVELAAIAQQWSVVLATLGPTIALVTTYVTDHAMFAIYLSQDESLISVHARLAGLRTRHIAAVTAIIAPPAADEPSPHRRIP